MICNHLLSALSAITIGVFAGSALAQDKPVQQPAASAKEMPALSLDARELPLGGMLSNRQLWLAYKSRFVTAQGRVVDTGNGMISHSEGQGYGILLAVAANDRPTFDRIWGWTRANLFVRDDQLMAWRWEPAQRPAVADLNNGTDGDLLVAWALTEAAEMWAELSYRVAARRIAVEVGRKLVLFKTEAGALLLPGINGFSQTERPDGPVINLSYYIFPAFARLKIVAPEYDWKGLTQTGLDLLKKTASSKGGLPSDWTSLKDENTTPAEGFPPAYAYNAVRIPLYLAWAGIGEPEHYAPFKTWSQSASGALPVVDIKTGHTTDTFREPGYRAIAELLKCVVEGGRTGSDFNFVRDGQNYYPATLHLLAIVAAKMRYASCAPA